HRKRGKVVTRLAAGLRKEAAGVEHVIVHGEGVYRVIGARVPVQQGGRGSRGCPIRHRKRGSALTRLAAGLSKLAGRSKAAAGVDHGIVQGEGVYRVMDARTPV